MRIFRSRIAAYFSFACGLSAFAVFAPFIAAQAPTAPPLEVAYFRAFRAYEASTHIAAPPARSAHRNRQNRIRFRRCSIFQGTNWRSLSMRP